MNLNLNPNLNFISNKIGYPDNKFGHIATNQSKPINLSKFSQEICYSSTFNLLPSNSIWIIPVVLSEIET